MGNKEKDKEPWPVAQLVSVIPYTKRLRVQFPVRAHT